MLKTLQNPLRGLLVATLLLAAAPASQATFDSKLADSLIKKINKEASDGDERVMYRIIRKALEDNPNEGSDLIDKIIKELRNSDKIVDSDLKQDLKRVKKKLRSWLRSHRVPNNGPVTPPESSTHAV